MTEVQEKLDYLISLNTSNTKLRKRFTKHGDMFTEIDISSYAEYPNLVLFENLFLIATYVGSNVSGVYGTFTYSYNNETGIITIDRNVQGMWISKFDVYF